MHPPNESFMTGCSCVICHRRYEAGDLQTCSECGEEGILDVEYDYRQIALVLTREILSRRPDDMWRYRELLPVAAVQAPPPLHIGFTPIYESSRLAGTLGLKRVWLKDDGRNPTNSFKDRASAVGVLKAREFGYLSIACASTGNAASSLAGCAAAAGLKSYIFVPERAPAPKITQLLIFGATVFKVLGSYEDAFELCREACKRLDWYNRNSGTNPFLVEGKKTAGHEIAEQLRDDIPEWVVVSVGDGCTIAGIGKGLQEMKQLGFITRVPRLLGVQAEGASPMYRAFRDGKDLIPSTATTCADSIAVGTPRNWRKAIAQIQLSQGNMVTVTDDEIMDAMCSTARLGGVFGEPAGVAGIAGLKKARAEGLVGGAETALVVITGNGLKDITAAQTVAGRAIDIRPGQDGLDKISDSLSNS